MYLGTTDQETTRNHNSGYSRRVSVRSCGSHHRQAPNVRKLCRTDVFGSRVGILGIVRILQHLLQGVPFTQHAKFDHESDLEGSGKVNYLKRHVDVRKGV